MDTTLVRMKKVGVAWLGALVLVAAAAGVASASAAATYPEQANKALAWVRTQQQADGSLAGFGAGSTVDALLAIIAAGQRPAAYAQGGNTPVTFLESKAAEIAKTPGGAGKLLLAVSALGRSGTQFGGVNLIDAINQSYDPNTGQYGKDVIGHAFAILGLDAAGHPIPGKAITYLDGPITEDGGWAFSGETGKGKADTNTTAVVIQAYVAAGVADRTHQQILRNAWVYLMSQQNPDGGFPYQKGGEFGSDSDVNSTAYVTQALLALGGEADAQRPLQWMLAMQKPSGAFQWMAKEPDDNAGATYQAIPALLGATLASPTGVRAAQPGMPRTGDGGVSVLAAAALALAVALLGIGVVARRRLVVRSPSA